MIAAIPASSAICGPSANGKNASLASTAPCRSWPCSRAFSTAIRTESTRLIWPAPIPIVCRSLRDHDRIRRDVLAHTPREEQVAPLLLGHLPGHDLHLLAVLDVGVALLHQHPAEHALVVALAGRLGAALAVAEDAQRLLRRAAPRPPRSSKPGASSTSTKCSAIRAPELASTGRLRKATQPNAETGSAASARSHASSIVAATATPHGFACLTITTAGIANSRSDAARALEVGEVVVRELLAAELLDPREQMAPRARPPRSTRRAGAGSRRRRGRSPCGSVERQLIREGLGVAEPVRDRRLVDRSRREGLAGEPPPRVDRRLPCSRSSASTASYCSGRTTARRGRSSSPRRAASTARRRRSSRRPRLRSCRAGRD